MPPMGASYDAKAEAYPSLMLTVPALIRAARRRARARSRVQIEALRPYGVSLALATTSSSVAKR